jgi:mRNA-degrading endonuclease YafQ of YafQ-DinJ toxin-antitoxin module
VRKLIWSPHFTRSLRRILRQNPLLRQPVEETLRQLTADPFHPSLHSHKLKGDLSGAWACTVDFDNRVLFEFVTDPASAEDAIHLLALGTHDEVY